MRIFKNSSEHPTAIVTLRDNDVSLEFTELEEPPPSFSSPFSFFFPVPAPAKAVLLVGFEWPRFGLGFMVVRGGFCLVGLSATLSMVDDGSLSDVGDLVVTVNVSGGAVIGGVGGLSNSSMSTGSVSSSNVDALL